ncbi:CBS domain-containing protein [Halolactibacillus miurensis]|uniref:CBS domain-containing protein n=1 Tax=Halolactibacillus miurensis TaxID=306541 RepID=A0A1I6R4U6_9BACI|nr:MULTISPECIES: cyclic-di-AMP-binding protein CbpB [Halolactibacillus]GEM03551.1 CBS domain-containing protein [Halolactibacillus miurensis]SFS59801.1 CBS domain-containing protein [Halolactibacillus miurensis]
MSLVKSLPLLQLTAESLMVSSEKVAHVQINNPLEHALLILVRSGYSSVPVLDMHYQFHGIISKNVILNEILGIERFEMERLSEVTVNEVMDTDIPTVLPSEHFLRCLKHLIDHPYIAVVNKQGDFDGILTRRAVLKEMNKYIHINKALFKDV